LETVGPSLSELPLFLAYMATAVALTLFYLVVYVWITPHREIALIRENNVAASIAIAESVSLVDCAVWGVIALVVQIGIFFLVRFPIPKISERIEKGEIASGVWLGGVSLAGGLLNASSMTS
jgi:putative membrane protein